jgi:hypothetical protein
MRIEQIRGDLAEELGSIHDIINTILDSFPDDVPPHSAIQCNDNAIVLLEYTRGYTISAFHYLDKLNSAG